ncbi:MAG TPA: RidA family protein [Candidatus Saccharimonadales bacterium]|nr:RidA family protein [Candidatus Saccharimonadales bacterium]
MKIIQTNNAPAAGGPYSQAIISGSFVFCSGQIGLDPKTGELKGADIISQTTQVIFNLSAVLEAAGSSLQNVIKTTCYLTNISDFQKFNDIYAKHFVSNPARATIEVSNLPKDAIVEIELVAEIVL